MPKYHDSGTVCKAGIRACPLGVSDDNHIQASSPKDFEERLAAKYSSSFDRVYSGLDEESLGDLDMSIPDRTDPVLGMNIQDLNNDDYAVVDMDSGTVVGTNLVYVPVPSDPDLIEEIYSSDNAAYDYAIENGKSIVISEHDSVTNMSNDDYMVIDKDTGIILGTNIVLVEYPKDEDVREELLSNDSFVFDYAQDNAISMKFE